MQIEKKIKKEINERGIKLRYIANQVGMPEDKLSRSLGGYRKLKPDEFVGLCRVLDLRLSDFEEAQQ